MWAWFKKEGGLFFPELLPAAYFVLISPIWEIQLIGRGSTLAALVLPVGLAIGCVVFYFACKEQLRWIGFLAIGIVLATAYATRVIGK